MFAYRYWSAVMNDETAASIQRTEPFIPPPTSRAFTQRYDSEKPNSARQFNPNTGNLEDTTPGSDLPLSP